MSSKKTKDGRPLSYFTNRIGLACVLIFFGYNVFYAIKNNTELAEWFIFSIVSSLGVLIGSPNKSVDKIVHRDENRYDNKYGEINYDRDYREDKNYRDETENSNKSEHN